MALATVIGLAASWIAFSVLVWAYGESPRAMTSLLFERTWGTAYGAGQVLFKATPILFTGVAVDLALRAGLFNIGAEGQLTVASLVAAIVGARLPDTWPVVLAAPVVLLAAAAAGAAWASIPALLRARFHAHEVISTIMMNRIADSVVGLAFGCGLALRGTVRTVDMVPGARLPRLETIVPALRGSAASVAIYLAIFTAIAARFWIGGTRAGREIALVGAGPVACAAERIPVRARIAQALVFSGAIAGLASAGTVLGYKGYYEQGLGAGAGFAGVAVALLGRGHPLGMIAAALLFGTLQQGGLGINGHVPMEIMDVISALVILSVALADKRVRAFVAREAAA
jgi:simple sugar transport system permease protein